MDYRLIRSNRKTVSLIINREGELVVRAPKNIAKRQIDLLVGQKQDWQNKRQSKTKRENPNFLFRMGFLRCLDRKSG